MSATLGRQSDPERPSRPSSLDSVQEHDSQLTAPAPAPAEPSPAYADGVDGAAGTSGASMIVLENVRKIYEPNVTALDGVSFVIDKGEFVFVVGASGSGKSTIIRLLLKELEPTSGRILVGGRDLGRLKNSKVPLLRRNVGCVFQDFKLLPNRTASENVAYALRVQGEPTASVRRKVPEVLNLVGLAHKMSSKPEELSGGEQQRVSIARAVVNHPPLLICDEPTGNLDPDTSVGIMQLLNRINTAGTTILMVTHDREMVDKMRKRVIALDQGQADARRAAWGVRDRMTRFKLVLSEALRSIGANFSTSVAATMTVLIGMFLLGLSIALGSWVVSWSDHVKSQIGIEIYFVDSVTPKQVNAVGHQLAVDQRIKSYMFVSKTEALKRMEKKYPRLTANLPSNPLPASFDVTPKNAEDVQAIAAELRGQHLRRGRAGEGRPANLETHPPGR